MRFLFNIFILITFLTACTVTNEEESIKNNKDTPIYKKESYDNINLIKEKFHRLYADFEKEKYNYSDPTNVFYESEFYTELKNFFSCRESSNIYDWEIREITGQSDIKSHTMQMLFNGVKYNVKFIGYSADFYVQSLTDSPLKNKSIFYQVWNDDEFYFGTLSEKSQDYFENFGIFYYDNMPLCIICGISGGFPGSGFLSGFIWNGEEFETFSAFRLKNSENLYIAGENKQPQCYNKNMNGKFIVFDKENYVEVSFCENGENLFGGIFSASFIFDNSKISVSSLGLDGSLYETEFVFEDGYFTNA